MGWPSDCYFNRVEVGNDVNALIQVTVYTGTYRYVLRWHQIFLSVPERKRKVSHWVCNKMPALTAQNKRDQPGEFEDS